MMEKIVLKTLQQNGFVIIPNYIEVHIKTINFFNRYLKYFKREMYILFKGQKKLEIFKIAPNHQKILWINI